MKPAAIMIHVPDVSEALLWYQTAFPGSQVISAADSLIAVLSIDGFLLEIVQEDEKVRSGPSGTVLYWSVASLANEIAHFENLNCTIYRGPIEIENQESMCQVRDPFGNLIGLRGRL